MRDVFPIYGGPLDGMSQPNTATIYCHRAAMPTIAVTSVPDCTLESDWYEYHLYDVGTGAQAFLPASDADLVYAFRIAKETASRPALAILRAEIERRQLDIG